jgi:hypothetical protein
MLCKPRQLTGYAYETIPGKAIITGKTKGPDDEWGQQFSAPVLRLPIHSRCSATCIARRTGNGSAWTVDLAEEGTGTRLILVDALLLSTQHDVTAAA